MKYQVILTEDGSHTVSLADSDITFHSRKGALQESAHVFIESGFDYYLRHQSSQKNLQIFEAGFGTGLNAFLTAIQAAKASTHVRYAAVDLHPLPLNIFAQLNYPTLLREPELFKTITQTPWNQEVYIGPFFKLNKSQADLTGYQFATSFDIIYFDAFAPNDQPELWNAGLFTKMYQALNAHGILVTYCSKSSVRKDLEAAGFKVEKLPGPPGKREIIRAMK